MNLRLRDLVYVPHGGERLGRQVAIVDGVFPDEVHIRRWHPGDKCFGRAEAVPVKTITELVPQTDRRWPAIRKYTVGHA